MNTAIGATVLALAIIGIVAGCATTVYVAVQAIGEVTQEAKDLARIAVMFFAAMAAMGVLFVAGSPKEGL